MRSSLVVLAVLAAGLLVGCGGGNPSAPSGEGVLVDGLVIGGAAALPFHASAGAAAGADAVTVACQENPAITATVGPDGRFTLRACPRAASRWCSSRAPRRSAPSPSAR